MRDANAKTQADMGESPGLVMREAIGIRASAAERDHYELCCAQ
jgi:hypothetical protein